MTYQFADRLGDRTWLWLLLLLDLRGLGVEVAGFTHLLLLLVGLVTGVIVVVEVLDLDLRRALQVLLEVRGLLHDVIGRFRHFFGRCILVFKPARL